MLKSIKKYGILVLVAMVVLVSCMDKNAQKNNYPGSGNYLLPVGDIYTIDTLLKMQKTLSTYHFTSDASVYGIVTGDEASGNLYKAAFIQEGNQAIELYMKSTSGLRIGDYIRVYLKGATLSEYSGTPQIQDLDPNHIVIMANNKDIAPDTVNIVDIPTGTNYRDYVCRLVTFSHVEFMPNDRDSTYAPKDSYGQYFLAQCDEFCNYVDTTKIMVRTSNYASFADVKLPQGNGTITGILTYYSNNSQWQFTIRSVSEVKMDSLPCHEPSPVIIPVEPQGTGTEDDPYNIAAAIDLETQTVTDSVWIRGYIVGSANILGNQALTNDDQISWEAPFDHNGNINNVILADSVTERNINNCIIVTLSNNTPSNIKENVNLQDHPENLGMLLKVRGLMGTKYYGRFGMNKSNEYELTDPE